MCANPSAGSLGQASLITAGASAVSGAIGSYYQAKGQKIALAAQSDTARTNATLAQINIDTNTGLSELNNANEQAITDTNIRSLTGTAAINAALTRTISGYNADINEGNAAIVKAVSTFNAGVADQNASDTLDAGRFAEQASRLATAQLISTQRVALAANGVDLSEGSAVNILTSSEYLGNIDAEIIHTNAVRAAMGYRVEALNERTSGSIAELNLKNEAAGQRQQGEVDAYNIVSTAAQTALNAKLQAQSNILARTQAARVAAINGTIQVVNFANQAAGANLTSAGINPALSAGTSLLASTGQVASKWYSYKQQGAA